MKTRGIPLVVLAVIATVTFSILSSLAHPAFALQEEYPGCQHRCYRVTPSIAFDAPAPSPTVYPREVMGGQHRLYLPSPDVQNQNVVPPVRDTREFVPGGQHYLFLKQ